MTAAADWNALKARCNFAGPAYALLPGDATDRRDPEGAELSPLDTGVELPVTITGHGGPQSCDAAGRVPPGGVEPLSATPEA